MNTTMIAAAVLVALMIVGYLAVGAYTPKADPKPKVEIDKKAGTVTIKMTMRQAEKLGLLEGKDEG